MTRYILFSALIFTAACKKPVEPEALTDDMSDNPAFVVDKTATRAPMPADRDEAIEVMAENFARVHFELDSDKLGEGSHAAIDANARIMDQFPRLVVEVQGHADERGTVEYNIALGERRASSVIDRMVAMGVAPSRLTAVSYGEEDPIDAGSGESAWSQNRRAEFRVLVADEADGMVMGTTR